MAAELNVRNRSTEVWRKAYAVLHPTQLQLFRSAEEADKPKGPKETIRLTEVLVSSRVLRKYCRAVIVRWCGRLWAAAYCRYFA